MSSTSRANTSEKPSTTNEDDVKKAAELKEWLEAKIQETELELSKLKEMMRLIDSNLRKSSFVPAIELRKSIGKLEAAEPKQNGTREESESIKELRRIKDGAILAKATIDPERVVITPEQSLNLSTKTAPFESFFVNRILLGFQSKDQEQSKNGALAAGQVLQYSVEEADGKLQSITIRNYRDKARLNEILSTITWAFTRMLEKK
ncbi:MAG: hypothetical protein ACYCQJ_11880 [Nitrososphaerales archaeon]